MVSTDTPRVWLGCLASYNNGTLHGEWVDAVDEDDLQENLNRILAESPAPNAEEYYIGDYDGFGDAGSALGEYASMATVAEVGAMIEEHGGAFAAYLGNIGDVDSAVSTFEEAFRGQWDSDKDFAYQFADDIDLFGSHGESVKNSELETYFDWDMWTRDLFLGGDFTSVDVPYGADGYGVYIFDNSI